MHRPALLPWLLLPALATAQVSPNDACADAIELTVAPGNVPGQWRLAHMVGAASAISPAACSGNGFRDVWFRFTATASTHYVLGEGPAMGNGARIEAFSGGCGSLTSLGCALNRNHLALTGLTPGSTYHVRAYGNTSAWSEGYLFVGVVSAPVNDDCANAIVVPVSLTWTDGGATVEGHTVGAAQSSAGCTTGATNDTNDDVWYAFTATASRHWVLVDPPTGLSLQVVGGTCAAPTSLLCKQTVNSSGAEEVSGLTPGQTYRYRVYAAGSDPLVRKRFFTGVHSAANNDDPLSAVPITVDAADAPQRDIPAPTRYATSSAQPAGCTDTDRDVWYRFVAPSSSVYMRDADSFALFSLYSVNVDGNGTIDPASMACIFSHDLSPAVATTLTPGSTYLLSVGKDGAAGDARFFLRQLATNNDCVDAIAIPVQSTAVPEEWTHADSHYATQSLPACSGNANQSDDDLWFSFTAPHDRVRLHVREDRPGTPLSASFEVFSGGCGALTSVFCAIASTQTVITGLTPGSTYRLRIYTSAQTIGDRLTKRIALTAAGNEVCAGAVPLQPTTLAAFQTLPRVATAAGGSSAVPACSGDPDDDLWYSFAPTGTTAAFVGAGAVNTFTAQLFSGGCGALTSLDCRSGLAGNAFRIHYEALTPGSTYHLRVHTGDNQTGTLTPMLFGPPANDEITGAALLTPSGTPYAEAFGGSYWTYGASKSFGRMCGTQGDPDDDVWFRFIATGAAHTITASVFNPHFSETDNSGGIRIEAYGGFATDSVTLDGLVLGCGLGSLALSGLTTGQDVYFRVFSHGGAFNHIQSLRVNVSAADNNEAAGALPIAFTNDWAYLFDTGGATQSQPGANCAATDVADDDIWFRFTANGQPGRIVVGHHDRDLTLQLFSGTPGSLTSLGCDGNMFQLSGLTAGQTYYFRLYSRANNAPVIGRLGLWSDPSLTANSLVDEACLGPVLLSDPSIEQGGACAPVFTDQGQEVYGTPLSQGWWHAGAATADSYSACADFDDAEEVPSNGPLGGNNRIVSRRGAGMGGFYGAQTADYGEYMQARLTQPLTPGEPYLVSFHVATANGVKRDGVGALLTTTALQHGSETTMELIPQVMATEPVGGSVWTNVRGVIIPQEPYAYITLGNFLSNNRGTSTAGDAYWFIDDVVVALVTDPGCVMGLGDVPDEPGTSAASGDALRIFPNPASDRVLIEVDGAMIGERAVLELYDATGRRVRAEQNRTITPLMQFDLPMELHEGMYVLMLRSEGRTPQVARVVVKR